MARVDRGGGGGWLAFIIGGLVVAVAIIGFVLWSNGASAPEGGADVDIDLNLPAPRLPDAPALPPVEPPSVPSPTPPPVPVG